VKVLQIISGDIWAGAEVQAFNLIKGISKLGSVNQHVLTFNDGVLSDRIQKEGIPLTILDETNRSLMSLFKSILATIRHIRPDVIHTHGFKENLIGGVAARLSRVQCIVRTYHGKGLIGNIVRYNIIELINARFLTDASIAVSHDLERFLVESGVPLKKITVIHNGIEPCSHLTTDKVKILRTELGVAVDEKVIGTIGRMVTVKDHKTLINGAKLILERYPKVKFLIVGDGPLKEELDQYAHDLGISPSVCFTGFREDAPDLLDLFDIFTLTSLHEGIPMALLEAMSLGKPVVVTRVGGMPEIIKDCVDGILIPSGGTSNFAEACISILQNDTLRASLSEGAQRKVQERFMLEAMVNKTHEIYRQGIFL
jgi:L-malate glycosyltransferase